MSDPQAIADRFQIEALRGEFTDASMMRDWDRFASRFTHDGAWRIPNGNVEPVARERSAPGSRGCESVGLLGASHHAGTIQLAGDTAVGCAYIAEFGRLAARAFADGDARRVGVVERAAGRAVRRWWSGR
jgi:hypothetical protein